MPATLSISYSGGKDPVVELDGMIQRLSDFTPIWPKVRQTVNEHQKEIFATSGFGSYAPLKPSTLKKKRRSSKPFDTISRRMVNSMTGLTGDSIYIITPTSCIIGTKGPAIYHQTGTGRMARRPFFMITDKLIEAVNKILRDYVEKK